MRESRKPPAYLISSVDQALRLASWLQLEGEITVVEASRRLGVARSTAHRLLTTLVYRDYAARSPSRAYVRGPALDPVRPDVDVTGRRHDGA